MYTNKTWKECCKFLYLLNPLYVPAVECEHLNLPRYGTIIGSGNAYGTVLSFECMKGFKHVGSVERRCQENGQWSGDAVTCTGNVFHFTVFHKSYVNIK